MSVNFKELVLITGTSSGIGEAIAKKFLDEGYEVIGIDREQPRSCVLKSYVNYTHYCVDITTGVNNLPLPSRPVGIIINNAGTQNSDDDMHNNFWSAYDVTERYLSENIKSVLMIASASAITGAEFPEYCASKGAMCAYGKNVAQRIGKYGATCNNLCPGGVYTKLNKCIIDDATKLQQVKDETLLGDWASPQQIAEWAYFLTAVNTFATGQDFLVDGGEASKSNFIW